MKSKKPTQANREIELMQVELQRLRLGLKTHERFASSVLRNLPDLQTVIHTQQALQQVYCVHGIQASDAVLTEPNGVAYASGATCLQLHQASVCFHDMSGINRLRAAPVPRDQIMVQFFAAMVTSGLTPKDLMQMKAETHQDEILEFLKATVGAGEMDQVLQLCTRLLCSLCIAQHSFDALCLLMDCMMTSTHVARWLAD
jgi:hypothetical protein